MTSYLDSARPHIKWGHIDGPMLSCRNGAVHFMTLWECVKLRFSMTTIEKLEAKIIGKSK